MARCARFARAVASQPLALRLSLFSKEKRELAIFRSAPSRVGDEPNISVPAQRVKTANHLLEAATAQTLPLKKSRRGFRRLPSRCTPVLLPLRSFRDTPRPGRQRKHPCDGAPTTALGTLPPEHNGARAMGRHGGRVLLLHAPAISPFFCVKIEQ